MESLVVVLLIMFRCFSKSVGDELNTTNEEEDFFIPGLITKVGYGVEVYPVQTADGYLLELHRILPKKQNHTDQSKNKNKPVVLIMHGLLATSECWVLNGKERSLGYFLLDNHFDVWLGNARGSRYSRKHVKMNADRNKKFWQFSWHEIGYYDLPAKIDYILNYTSESSLYYIGHSQGTTSFYVMASEHPQYNKKIRLMISLAPVAFMSHLPGAIIRFLARFIVPIQWILEALGIIEIPSSGLALNVIKAVCTYSEALMEVCLNLIFAVSGREEPEQFDRGIIPTALNIMPGGASIYQVAHYGQEINSGYFRQYDYGTQNMFKYGRLTPPSYDLKKITAPVALFYSSYDWLASTTDVQRLGKQLPNVVKWKLIAYEKFTHLDFVIARDVRKLVYDEVLELMKKFH